MDLNGYIADYNLSDQRYDNSESRAYNVGYNYYYESEDAELYDYARRVCSREAREFVSGYDCAAYDE